jgi:hypothetical protein
MFLKKTSPEAGNFAKIIDCRISELEKQAWPIANGDVEWWRMEKGIERVRLHFFQSFPLYT